MQKLFLEIYLFLLCINAGIMIVEATPTGTPLDIPLISPMDASTQVNSIAMPSIYNTDYCTVAGEKDFTIGNATDCGTAGGTWTIVSGTLEQDINTNVGDDHCVINGVIDWTVANQTDCTTASDTWESELDPVIDNIFWPFAVFELFINFLTGGFIWSLFAIFGFPSIFVWVMQTVIGMLLVVTIIYYFTGR